MANNVDILKLVKTSTRFTAFYIFIYETRNPYKTDQDGTSDGFWVFTDAIWKFPFNPAHNPAHKAKFETN